MALDLSNLRQLPALANRPNFPSGLNVLLLCADARVRQESEELLRENYYSVVAVTCVAEAAAYVSNPEHAIDVLLADVKCMQQKSPEHAALVQAAKTVPLVLMSESGAPSEVMLGIKLGAVDFLERPLSPLKLKNIWQHTVRRMLASHPNAPSHLKKGVAASGTASPEDSGGAGSGLHSQHGASGDESGSNASTSDQAPVKADVDAEMETSSFQEAMNSMVLAGLAPSAGASGSGAGAGSGPDGAGAVPAGGCDAGAADSRSKGSRPQPLKYKASRPNMPSSNGSGSGSGGSSGGPAPALGYPAGQLPPLPAGVVGIAWGLPTNPLQISPKAPPMGGLMGAMGPWGSGIGPVSPMGPMNPMASMMPPGMFPQCPAPTTMFGSPGGSMANMAALPTPACSNGVGLAGAPGVGMGMGMGGVPGQGHGMAGLHMSSSCMALSSAGGLAAAAAEAMKRADSAPLPALSSLSDTLSAGAATGNTAGLAAVPGAEGLMPPPPARSVGNCLDKAELFVGLDAGKPAPIGLQLKKSPSLVDFISQTLIHSDGLPAC